MMRRFLQMTLFIIYTTFSVSRFRYVEDDEIGFEKSLAPCVFV